MATDAKDARIKEIEDKLAQLRATIKRSQEALEKMRDDPDMLADAGVKESGRIKTAQDEIKQLEAELRSSA